MCISKKLIAALVVLAGSHALAQTIAPTPARVRRHVAVSIPDRKLAVLEEGRRLRVFSIAVGAPASPSPTGNFEIINRVAHPTYYHPGEVIPPGKDNPLGTRWVGLNKKSYGIHGTNAPHSIGKAASHGCIRLRNRDMELLFAILRVGDSVEIRGERDPQLTRIFDSNEATVLAGVHGTSVGGGQ
jgi:lipoprotein-anchoring transpeptidase ErfK/SrfK